MWLKPVVPVIKVAVPVPLYHTFDYLPPVDAGSIVPGLRVLVPFGRRRLVGVIIDTAEPDPRPEIKLKPIISVLDKSPSLNRDILNICKWVSAYYQSPIGETVQLALPVLLRKAAPIKPKPDKRQTYGLPEGEKKLNREQQRAVTGISANLSGFKVHLLYGVTGSGKTEVYLHIIQQILARGQQVLALIPEISLSPQTVERFQQRFAEPIAVQHSKMNNRERWQSWENSRSGTAKIIISTRSGIFNQFANLGLIIIDEEHDMSYKQQSGVRYSARDIAVMRAKRLNIPIILGSATPSMESYYKYRQGAYLFHQLNIRASKGQTPKLRLEDLRNAKSGEAFTPYTLKKIADIIKRKLQALIFINRRGFARVSYCPSCGHMEKCPRCEVNLTLHKTPPRLLCHHCGFLSPPPKKCKACGSDNIITLGAGTQKIAGQLSLIFPASNILRIDRDTTGKKNSWHELYREINTEEPAILVGTQMLAKGHHFPNVTLVVILDVDLGLASPDFRAQEYLAQLIVQVSGRAGRGEHEGEVILQTREPANMILQALLDHDYPQILSFLLQERKDARFPPVTSMAIIHAESLSLNNSMAFLRRVKKLLASDKLELLGPLPSPLEKRAGRFRCQLVAQTSDKAGLQKIISSRLEKITKLPEAKKTAWSIDVDPVSF